MNKHRIALGNLVCAIDEIIEGSDGIFGDDCVTRWPKLLEQPNLWIGEALNEARALLKEDTQCSGSE